jgi:DNA-binding PucR family transcriptional regulator
VGKGDPDELLEALARSGGLSAFRELVRPLEDYDREHNSDLIRTLSVFFDMNANASETAERLFLHRNSLAYRLDRIRQITGLDLKSPETRLALQLGLLASSEERSEG